MPPDSDRLASTPSSGAMVHYPRPWLAVITVSFGSIAVMAASIGLMNLLLPRMMAELGADIRSIQWVQTAFMLSMLVLMPAVGWLGAAVGQKRLYLASLAIFGGGTVLCTLAWNIPSMIACRVVQGIGAGLLFPMGTPFVFDAFPPQRRGVVLGVRIVISSIGSLGGSVLAAHLADVFGWRWGFYYLLVFCAAGLAMGSLVLRERPLPEPGRFDLAGYLSLGVGLVSFVLLITQRDGQSALSGSTLGLAALCIFSIAAFFIIERHIAYPFVDLGIYRHTAYAAGCVLAFLLPGTTVAVSFLLPIYLQRLLGYSILQTALLRVPMGIAMVAITPLSGWLSDRIDPRLLTGGGLLGFVLALYALSGLSLYTSAFTLALIMTAMGVCSTLIFTPMYNAMFSSLPHESIRLGSGLYGLKGQLGRSIGIAAISVLFTDRLGLRYASLSESLVPTSPTFRLNLQRLSAGLRDLGALHPDAGAQQVLYRRLGEEASAAAFGDCYFILAGCLLLCLIPVYFIRRTAPPS
ncbi:MAG: DHA2 family efflux MFS transporter permease subunit [Candidatus Latescibacteria bacterium]|nr:DHA2 family efflux MFS transporter permease subunit [Candidatus Latescibacterota bacterium]